MEERKFETGFDVRFCSRKCLKCSSLNEKKIKSTMGKKIDYNKMKAEHDQIKMKQRQWRKYREKEEITDGEEDELRSKIVAMIPERIRRKSDRREITLYPLHQVALNSNLNFNILGLDK